VDINAGAQDQPPPDEGTAADNIQVKCGVAARLVALSDNVQVDSEDWVLREFDQPAVVEWDWSVTAVKTHPTQVRLELRPAIADADGRHIVPAAEDNTDLTAGSDVDVTVTATRMERFYDWWDENWGPLKGILAALGVGIIGCLGFLAKVRGMWPFKKTAVPSGSGESGDPGAVPTRNRRRHG
jgi:hypothetical protein